MQIKEMMTGEPVVIGPASGRTTEARRRHLGFEALARKRVWQADGPESKS